MAFEKEYETKAFKLIKDKIKQETAIKIETVNEKEFTLERHIIELHEQT